MKLYLCGPMTGLPDFNRAGFERARKALRMAGFEVVCPVELHEGQQHKAWHEYMRVDVRAMLECDGVALLAGWAESRGAKIEATLAAQLLIQCSEVWQWMAHGKGGEKPRTDTDGNGRKRTKKGGKKL